MFVFNYVVMMCVRQPLLIRPATFLPSFLEASLILHAYIDFNSGSSHQGWEGGTMAGRVPSFSLGRSSFPCRDCKTAPPLRLCSGSTPLVDTTYHMLGLLDTSELNSGMLNLCDNLCAVQFIICPNTTLVLQPICFYICCGFL